MLKPGRRAHVPVFGDIGAHVDICRQVVAIDIARIRWRRCGVRREARLGMLASVVAVGDDVIAYRIRQRLPGLI